MSTKNSSILISGAGIAGPALAYWLKSFGFTSTVIERAPQLREGGYPIDVRDEAVQVAKLMGGSGRACKKSRRNLGNSGLWTNAISA